MKPVGVYLVLLLVTVSLSCKKFLDIVPDNVATLENAFTMRSTALRYLFTCYAYMPQQGSVDQNPALLGGDEAITAIPVDLYSNIANDQIGRGFQNRVNPYLNYWDGAQGGKPMFEGIRTCNIFLENVNTVIDLSADEKKKWAAEAKFLKAYYHFWLLRMYGPIPLVKENLPISADVNEVKVERQTVDDCFNYIVQLLDEAAADLPLAVQDRTSELGRITRPIASAFKAKVLVYAASPLFNGNAEFSGLKNKAGVSLFNPDYKEAKWELAANACKEAIELCHSVGYKLHYFQAKPGIGNLSDGRKNEMNVRGSVTEKWNSEVIWGNPNFNSGYLQVNSQPKIDFSKLSNNQVRSLWSPTLKMAELFYTKNGVPIKEDKTWAYNDRYKLKVSGADSKLMIKEGYITATLNFDREARFYADLGFDGGIWYGQGKFNENNTFWVEAKAQQAAGGSAGINYSATGYFLKKVVHYENVILDFDYSVNQYPWPVIRLADLYLLYAEALNEASGPSDDVFKYLDEVRERAGLLGVKQAWTTYSKFGSKFDTKSGLQEIIRQERLIEMAFEGNRFWDLRRWKIASEVLNDNVNGWDIQQEDAQFYYRVKPVFTQTFGLKDYFWPISERSIIVNRNLVQNLGW